MKISDIFRRYRIRPLKRLGQNFLVDNNIRDKICTALDLNRSDRVLEIGAGFGVLSERLADTCSHLWAVEKDAKLCAILKKEILPGRDNITVLHDDILQIRLGTLAGKHTIKVVGNLPYYITTKILFYLVAYRTSISSAIRFLTKSTCRCLKRRTAARDSKNKLQA